ncbi:MAG TPA: hypothetical protein VGT05_00835 [Patescibacteria group bacterium]|nr:hypothetical protein [Patescibacteria group bacterium]
MQSFILLSFRKKSVEDYLDIFHNKHTIDRFDRTTVASEGSIGIEIIRNLQQVIFLSPLKGKEKSIIITHAERLTHEAQNALLKILEEPPAHVFLFLLTTRLDGLLPTVISRCQLVRFSEEPVLLLQEEKEHLQKDILTCLHGTIGEKLMLAEKIATDEMFAWTQKILPVAREQFLDEANQELLRLLTQLQYMHQLLQTTTVNKRFLAEHMLLSL